MKDFKRWFLIGLVLGIAVLPLNGQTKPVVLQGGTVLDFDQYGRSENDLTDAVVVLLGGLIRQVGKRGQVKIPKGAQLVDVKGKYLMPGLIDGFATLNNQAYANAFLCMGVTTIVGLDNDNRRGQVFYQAAPSPAIMKLENYGGARYQRVVDTTAGGREAFKINYVHDHSPERTRQVIDSLAATGVKVLLVHYGVKAEQLPVVVEQARKHGMVTIGELGRSTYQEAVQAGLQSFVHTSRYTVDMLPPDRRRLHTYSPFGRGGQAYYQYLTEQQDLSQHEGLRELAKLYTSSQVGLLPTASLVVYPYMDFAQNPWQEPAATLIDEKDIEFEPLDRTTGKFKTPAPMREKAAPFLWQVDKILAQQGAKYLTGSGTDAFGTLPGVSLHTELAMLSSFGLSNRQVIAAATGNFALLWGWKHLGKIAPGREADILVLEANPLESLNNLKHISWLYLDGVPIQPEQLLKR